MFCAVPGSFKVKDCRDKKSPKSQQSAQSFGAVGEQYTYNHMK